MCTFKYKNAHLLQYIDSLLHQNSYEKAICSTKNGAILPCHVAKNKYIFNVYLSKRTQKHEINLHREVDTVTDSVIDFHELQSNRYYCQFEYLILAYILSDWYAFEHMCLVQIVSIKFKRTIDSNEFFTFHDVIVYLVL